MVSLQSNLHAACFSLMKLIPARYMLDRAEDDGLLTPGGTIVETTSGTFGLALAMLAAIREYRLRLVTASSLIDDSFKRRLEFLGADLTVVPDPEGTGGQKERLTKLQEILSAEPKAFWPNQYDNPGNALSYGGVAETLVRTYGRIDCLVGCVGSGGSLSGTGSLLRLAFPNVKIVAVDTHGSALFGQKVGRRLLRGLGNSILPANLDHNLIDEVHWVGAAHAWTSTRSLYRRYGLYMGPTSGAAVLVAQWAAAQDRSLNTVVILPDEGHRYVDTVYSNESAIAFGLPAAIAGKPKTIDVVRPGSEAEWLRMAWQRRSLTDPSLLH
jgi:cysteine synthase A